MKQQRALRLVASRPEATVSPDTEALTRVANGDLGGLETLYDRHAAALLRFAIRVVGPSDAEDVVHATFVRAAQVATTYDGRGADARSWLFGITARLAQERRRSLARLARALLRLDPPSTATRSDDDRTDMTKALTRLSPTKSVVLVLAEVEGYSCEEIAAIVGVPVGTVWTRLHHARRELRAIYERGSS